jgi:hypothetical protein
MCICVSLLLLLGGGAGPSLRIAQDARVRDWRCAGTPQAQLTGNAVRRVQHVRLLACSSFDAATLLQSCSLW